MVMTHGPGPMAEEEQQQLDALLSAAQASGPVMSLEMLDGFFSALVVGPEPVMASEYLPYVWGERSPWENPAQADRAMGLAMGLWNHVAWRVGQLSQDIDDPDAWALLMPCLAVPPVHGQTGDEDEPLAGVPADFPFGAGWAHGFLLGVSLRAPAWQQLVEGDDDLADDLSMVVALSVINDDHAQALGVPQIMDLDERVAAVTELPGMLRDLNLLRLQALVPKPVRRQATPGRNDRCRCGSGKKFKKCCGAQLP